MSRRLLLAAGVVAAVLLWGQPPSAETRSASVPPHLSAFVEMYYNALTSGNLGGIYAMLGSPERERNAGVLSNPTYSEFLVKRYRNSMLELLGSGIDDAGRAFVEIAIMAEQEVRIKERLTFGNGSDAAGGVSGLRIVGIRQLN